MRHCYVKQHIRKDHSDPIYRSHKRLPRAGDIEIFVTVDEKTISRYGALEKNVLSTHF